MSSGVHNTITETGRRTWRRNIQRRNSSGFAKPLQRWWQRANGADNRSAGRKPVKSPPRARCSCRDGARTGSAVGKTPTSPSHQIPVGAPPLKRRMKCTVSMNVLPEATPANFSAGLKLSPASTPHGSLGNDGRSTNQSTSRKRSQSSPMKAYPSTYLESLDGNERGYAKSYYWDYLVNGVRCPKVSTFDISEPRAQQIRDRLIALSR